MRTFFTMCKHPSVTAINPEGAIRHFERESDDARHCGVTGKNFEVRT